MALRDPKKTRPDMISRPSNLGKDPDRWVTGDHPMTDAQSSYYQTLCEHAGVDYDPNLTKAQAAERIDELQKMTGVGRGTRSDRDPSAPDPFSLQVDIHEALGQEAPPQRERQPQRVNSQRPEATQIKRPGQGPNRQRSTGGKPVSRAQHRQQTERQSSGGELQNPNTGFDNPYTEH